MTTPPASSGASASAPILSASQYEAQKNSAQRAEDIAYTINHALACTVTDFIDPYVGNWTQEYLGKRFSIGCGHDHSQDGPHNHSTCGHAHHMRPLPSCGKPESHGVHIHGPGCKHDHPLIPTSPELPEPHPEIHHDAISHTPPPRAETPAPHTPHHAPPPPKSHLKHWMIGEITGDFGAVPVTIAFQRFAPGLMDGIRHVVEPVLGPVFRMGAAMSARKWARESNLATNSDACQQKQEEIYDHEIRHLPQALIWTASSISINLATQRLLGNRAPLWQMAAGKATGASISAGLVVAGRAAMPRTARSWDQATSKYVFLPLTKVAGSLAGISSQDVDRMASTQEKLEGKWANQLENQAQDAPARQR